MFVKKNALKMEAILPSGIEHSDIFLEIHISLKLDRLTRLTKDEHQLELRITQISWEKERTSEFKENGKNRGKTQFSS